MGEYCKIKSLFLKEIQSSYHAVLINKDENLRGELAVLE